MRQMGSFEFTVVAGDDGRVPIDVAGSVMVNVQRLLSSLGEYCISRSLHLTGNVPENMLGRFRLFVDGSYPSISSSSDMRFESRAMLNEILSDLLILLDNLDEGSLNKILAHFSDPRYRMPILRSVIDLSRSLDGHDLAYSVKGHEGKLTALGGESLEFLMDVEIDNCITDVPGILRRTPGNVLFLELSNNDVDLVFDGDIDETGHVDLLNEPCVINGLTFFSIDGEPCKITKISSVEAFPSLSFDRGISPDNDLELKVPLVADVVHNGDSWSLSSGPLGILVTRRCLDDAILEFHSDFVFMWEMYVLDPDDGPKDELSADERSLRDQIISLI